MNIRSFLICLGTLLVMGTSYTAAQTAPRYQNIEQLRKTVRSEVEKYYKDIQPELEYGQDLFIEISHLDSRLQLGHCDDNFLTMKINTQPHGNNRLTVKTHCKSGSRWTIYVPVTVEIYSDVVVSAADIPKGTLLTESDLVIRRRNTAKMNIGITADPQKLIGLETTRPMRAGSPILAYSVKKPRIIAKGDEVLLVAKSTALNVEVNGTALESGYIGQKIRVRNKQSKRVVNGLITGPGEVRVAAY